MGFHESVAQLGLNSPYDAQLLDEARGDWSRFALFKGVIAQESNWNPRAVNPNDPSYGLMQLTLPTAQQFSPGVQPETLTSYPDINIAIGTAFLRDLLVRFSDSDAIAYYNAGCPTPKVAGLSGCPLRNQYGQYTNSLGSTAVQAHVDSVLTYQVYYLNHLPVETLSPEPVAAGDGWSPVVDDVGWPLDLSLSDLGGDDIATAGVMAALLVGGALLVHRYA